VVGNLYVGRTSAGGVGSAIDLDNDGNSAGDNDVTFGASCGFILQLANGRVTAVEADRAVTAVVQGQTVTLSPFSPVTLIASATTSFEAESATMAGEAKLQACSACSGGQRVGFIGNVATNGAVALGTLTFTNVNVPAPGTYVASLFYTSQENRTATLTVNGVPGSPIAFPSSGSFDTVARLDVVVRLNAGDNTIAIGNNTSRAPSIDRLVVNVQ
jgi:hypothetical protein